MMNGIQLVGALYEFLYFHAKRLHGDYASVCVFYEVVDP